MLSTVCRLPGVGFAIGLFFELCAVPGACAQSHALLDSVSVYPNPAHIRATVTVPAVTGATRATITLLDAQGVVVFEQPVSLLGHEGGTAEVPLLGRRPGLYRVQVRVGDRHAAHSLKVE